MCLARASPGLQPSFGKEHPSVCCWCCCCSPGALDFHEFIVNFETPSPPLPQSSLGVGGIALGRSWNRPNPAQSPILGSKGELCPSHSQAQAQLSAHQNPWDSVFPWVCGLGKQLGSAGLVNPCWNSWDVPLALQVPPHTPPAPHLSSPHSVFSQPFTQKTHKDTTVETRGNKYK